MNLWDKMSAKLTNILNLTKLEDKEFAKQLLEAEQFFDTYFEKSKNNYEYLDPVDINKYKGEYYNLYQNALSYKNSISSLFKFDVRKKSRNFIEKYDQLDDFCKEINDSLVDTLKPTIERLILPVEGKNLDEQQITAIAKDAYNHLVLAGAGTGKTTTIVGYIKFLLASHKANPEDILVLSFTNASASEMSDRLKKETSCKLEASTFHKFGMKIITEVENKKPTIYTANIKQFIKNEINKLCEDKSYFNKLCLYIFFYGDKNKSEFEFENDEEYQMYLKSNPPTTLKGETVKSYGEVMIANFLYINGLKYEYETPYKFDTATMEYSQYKPDFYLPDYDIYVEYYGIDRNGKVPKYFKDKDGKTASDVYRDSMYWKRMIHKQNGTKCIELFAYEHFENVLLDNLVEHLNDYGVKYKHKSLEEIWNQSTDNNIIEGIVDMFGTIINLIKSNDCDFEELKRRNETLSRPIKIDIIIDLIKPIYDSYQNMLIKTKQIDFNDMISKAKHYIDENKYIHNYKYVVIDEYQDISQSRFKLLYSLRQQKPYKLFCVGDDWQSIYRFSGSDIGFILDFSKYWGPTVEDKIETTYRFSQSLIDISGYFIMQNKNQKVKSLISKNTSNTFALEEINGYQEKYAIEFMEKKIKELPKNASVLLLGRYTFDINILDSNLKFKYKYNNADGKVHVEYYDRKDLDITFMTVHASKGLQADYVFIINNKFKGMGFPSRISDAPILQLLLDSSDSYPYSEERRLYYVALTRAKKKVFLITIRNNISPFVEEIKNAYGEQIKKAQYTCPECGGRLILKNGKYGKFFGCSNYSKTGCKYIRKI
jgi:DNA helicase IV